MTKQPKIGGQSLLRILVKDNGDIERSFLLHGGTTPHQAKDLGTLIRENHQFDVAMTPSFEAFGRSDLVLQQLQERPVPPNWQEQTTIDAAFLESQFQTRLAQDEWDIILLSIEPDICNGLWRDRDSGCLFHVPQQWLDNGNSRQHDWLHKHLEPTGLLPVEGFQENFLAITRALKERSNAHILVSNVCSIDPHDQTDNYHGINDTFAIRAQRFNLALIEISRREGISIIDVDRIIAERGGDRLVVGPYRYTDEAHQMIREELVRVMADIGFFEQRPLLAQIGQKR